MRRMTMVALAMVGIAIFVNGCSLVSGKPYVDFQDLNDRGVPTDGFSMTGFELKPDNTIELRFYTHGKPEDRKLIEPTIEKVEYLTQNLRKKHPIRVVFVDGNPFMTSNDKPVGTGEVIKEVNLPIAQ